MRYNPRLKPPYGSKPDLQHPFCRDLVGWWMFTEDGGPKAFDLSGKGNHGTLYGPAWGGNTLGFDGDDYVAKINPSFLSDATGTVTMWVKKTANSRYDGLFSVNNNHASGNLFYIRYGTYDNDYTIYHKDTAANYRATYDQGDSTNVWQFIAFAVGAGGNNFYVDGKEVTLTYESGNAASTEWFSVLSGADRVEIGKDYGSQYFDGLIGDVRIYNRALTAAEVNALFVNTLTGEYKEFPRLDVSRFFLPPVGAVAPTSTIYGPLHGPFAGPV